MNYPLKMRKFDYWHKVNILIHEHRNNLLKQWVTMMYKLILNYYNGNWTAISGFIIWKFIRWFLHLFSKWWQSQFPWSSQNTCDSFCPQGIPKLVGVGEGEDKDLISTLLAQSLSWLISMIKNPSTNEDGANQGASVGEKWVCGQACSSASVE